MYFVFVPLFLYYTETATWKPLKIASQDPTQTKYEADVHPDPPFPLVSLKTPERTAPHTYLPY